MIDEYSRPATFDDLKKLIGSLNHNDVPYVLVGGYALFAHGYHRATEDIDLLIPASVSVGEKLIKALMVLPDQAARDLPLAWFNVNEAENIRLADEFVVDILFNACGESYESLRPYFETVELDKGLMVNTINLEGLLLTKQTVREKDKVDRMVIERALALLGK